MRVLSFLGGFGRAPLGEVTGRWAESSEFGGPRAARRKSVGAPPAKEARPRSVGFLFANSWFHACFSDFEEIQME
jgi:hypothetical protein